MNMARTGYDFQSLTQENRDWKEARAMSKEIIQFDQAMFETRLCPMSCAKAVGRSSGVGFSRLIA